LVWGILSALALAFYTIQPVGLLRSFSPAAITGWGMLVGGIVLSIGTQPWSFSGTWDGETWLAFAYIVLFGTVLPPHPRRAAVAVQASRPSVDI
jgi:drug/metabolite transporter (DMT)-like permease